MTTNDDTLAEVIPLLNPVTRIEQLDAELNDLDIPVITLDTLATVIAESIGVDPIEFYNNAAGNLLAQRLFRAALDQSIENSQQLSDIQRALEIGTELARLENGQ